MIIQKLMTLSGIILIFTLVWLFSEDRKKFPWRIVFWGLIWQFSVAIFVLNVPAGVWFFHWLGERMTEFLNFSKKGSAFLFGNLGSSDGQSVFGFQFAIIVTSTVIFVSSFVAVLYHYRIMQKVVYAVAWVMAKTMGTSGAETLAASGHIFMLGQTESPLLIRHYLNKCSKSEINTIMVGGFATIAGGVMAAYIQMGIPASILIISSLISAPGSLMLSKILIPPTSDSLPISSLKNIDTPQSKNALEAVSHGASEGMKLSINIIAMLLAFLALIAVVDGGLGELHKWFASVGFIYFPNNLKEILGYAIYPFAWLLGLTGNDAYYFSTLVGTKIGINEFIAYLDASQLIKSGAISQRTAVLASYALCGFSNFSSIAIQIGGIGSLVPEKRSTLAQLGLKAMFIGALTNILTAFIASLLT
ncbi:MAG: NupC/NupG family nucleoside CNT transporter [Candidatus Kapabacteria bacterium]|nr:NupC/NupG family nucleoside CNT transporter [Candidatus Kapabacteria bacterium]